MIEEGLVAPKTPGKVRMETPAGLVEVSIQARREKSDECVKLTNVKSYLAAIEQLD